VEQLLIPITRWNRAWKQEDKYDMQKWGEIRLRFFLRKKLFQTRLKAWVTLSTH
jgi:hypothetical protein